MLSEKMAKISLMKINRGITERKKERGEKNREEIEN